MMADKIIKWNDKLLTFNDKIIRTEAYAAPTPSTYPTDHLIERWDFNDNLDGLNGNGLTYEVGTLTYATGLINKCLSLNGSTRIATTSTTIRNAFAGTHAFSISFWMKDTYNGTNQWDKITANQPWYPTPSVAFEINVNSYSSVKNLTFYRSLPGTEQYGVASTSSNFTNQNAWIHVVCTYASDVYTIYRNGVFNCSNTDSGALTVSMAKFAIGTSSYGTDTYTGLIDLYYVYDKALSLSEVEQLYNNGTGV
jgi:hypothetical protein